MLGDLALEWHELKSMGIMVRIRQESDIGYENELTIRYYVSSKELSEEELYNATHTHWGVEVMY